MVVKTLQQSDVVPLRNPRCRWVQVASTPIELECRSAEGVKQGHIATTGDSQSLSRATEHG